MKTRALQTRRLVDAHHYVQALNALSRRAFHHVINRREQQKPIRVFINFETYVTVVRALSDFGVWKLVTALQVLDEANERFALVCAAERFPNVLVRDWLCGERVDGCEYASDHIDRVRRKRNRHGLSA